MGLKARAVTISSAMERGGCIMDEKGLSTLYHCPTIPKSRRRWVTLASPAWAAPREGKAEQSSGGGLEFNVQDSGISSCNLNVPPNPQPVPFKEGPEEGSCHGSGWPIASESAGLSGRRRGSQEKNDRNREKTMRG